MASAVNPEPYEAYLMGLYRTNELTESGLLKAIEYYDQALRIDPDYALGARRVAETYAQLGNFGMWDPLKAFPKAKAESSLHGNHSTARIIKRLPMAPQPLRYVQDAAQRLNCYCRVGLFTGVSRKIRRTGAAARKVARRGSSGAKEWAILRMQFSARS